MLFSNTSFHDSQILEVKENESNQIDFVLDFPIDWEKNKFGKKMLRFRGVVLYTKKEILFDGYPSILEIKTFDRENSLPYKILIETNVGNRELEFADVELIDYT